MVVDLVVMLRLSMVGKEWCGRFFLRLNIFPGNHRAGIRSTAKSG
ncbi:hypothetical protein cgR_5010 [Corynebacterium glutamicum R]|uniref:Uncharacterized protein n=1 Tax=Corynebacterium glutamicum (strain R) TaxID=340322 RepID=A0AB72V8Q8_CORGB|nr:hypothetical protein cgR_5010 [Corynebacterium glutamicum R]